MHTLTLKIQDNVLDKVIYFLSHLPKQEVEIIEDKIEPKTFQVDMSSFKDDKKELFDPKEFYGILSQNKKSIDDYLANSRDEWEEK